MIKLIPFNKAHFEKSRKWMNDPELCRLFNRVYRSWSKEDQEKWYAQLKKDRSQLVFAIIYNGIYVGNIGLKEIDHENKKGEYYILIGDKKYWNKGIGTKASKLLLSKCKRQLKLNKIYLQVAESNKSALKLYKKIGFVIEGRLKNEFIREGKHITMIRMAFFMDNSSSLN